MLNSIILGAALVFVVAGSAMAGPCTQRLADLEKSILAKQEGAGPALDPSTTTGSTGSNAASNAGQGVNFTAQSQGHSDAMRMIQEAKQLDQQGKEAECMDRAARISAMAPPATK